MKTPKDCEGIVKEYIPFMRHPKTTQEIRANQECVEQGVRPRRKKLPTVRDDIFLDPKRITRLRKRKMQQRRKGGD